MCSILKFVDCLFAQKGLIKFHKSFKSFTLAEVLIVIGIIGVVATLTLPNLNQSTNNKETVVQLQKLHANLEDALGRAVAKYGPIKNWCKSNDINDINDKFANRFVENLKITKSCSGAGDNACFINPYIDSYPPFNQYILADGSSINVYFTGTDSNYASNNADINAPERHTYGFILVDVNGVNKGENKAGYDIFRFLITTKGIVPAGSENASNKFIPTTIPSNVNDHDQTAWILTSGNMDYLKTKNGLCPNDTALSWTNLTCK